MCIVATNGIDEPKTSVRFVRSLGTKKNDMKSNGGSLLTETNPYRPKRK